MRRDVFQAIADPTRRAILDLLAREPRRLNDVSDHFQISRPAISKHVRILSECGLLHIRPHGRERYCYIMPGRLREVNEWTQQYRRFWNRKLDALEQFLERDASTKKQKSSPKKRKS